MTKLLWVPVLLLCLSFVQKTPESVPEYQIDYTRYDELPTGTGEIVFTFNNENGVTQDSIRFSYNGTEKKVKPDANGHVFLNLKSGKYRFQFFLDHNHYEIYTDSIPIRAATETGMTVWFSSSIFPIEAEKPVIYFYPEYAQQVNVQLEVKGQLGFSYPLYNEGWSFIADPDGTIHMNEKEYDYLFWDGHITIRHQANPSTGFIVSRDSLIPFFEKQLTAMGLNAREQQDFITYWCPLMQKNQASFVHFLFNDEYEAVSEMNITPKPDNIFRVFMLWSDGADVLCNAIVPQKIESVTREGFTVVEWGGGELSAQSAVRSSSSQ